MAFRWKAQKSTQSNLRRLARGQLRGAIEELTDPLIDQADAVHDARLRLKKTRSLLRLARPAARAEFRRQNAALGDAARTLALERDRQAVIEALDKLLAHAEREWGESAGHLRSMRRLRDGLVAAHQRETNGAARAETVRQVTIQLQLALERLGEWTSAAEDEQVIVAGFTESYRRARRALKAALAHPSAAGLHEWRKQIKYHRYQVRLFQHAWPAALEVHCDELKRLTDLLGDDHDLVLVRQMLERPANRQREGICELLDLLDRRRLELQAEAIPLGRLLFAEKPKRISRRIKQYWCVYREGGNH